MKKILLLLVIFCLFGCRTVKESSKTETKEFHGSKETEINKHYESLYFGIIDSLQRVKAPVENSVSFGKKYSHLQTSLAWSTANLDSLGVLTHEIGNKDSIEARIKYIYNDRHIHDTAYISKTDTVFLSKTKEVTKVIGMSRLKIFFLYSGYLFWISAILILIIYLIKRNSDASPFSN